MSRSLAQNPPSSAAADDTSPTAGDGDLSSTPAPTTDHVLTADELDAWISRICERTAAQVRAALEGTRTLEELARERAAIAAEIAAWDVAWDAMCEAEEDR